MQDALRAYMELALGLGEASRKRAEQVTRDLVGKGGATAAQLQTVAEELVSASRTNQQRLANLVRFEVERALEAVGLATSQEVADLTARVGRLERTVRELSLGAATADRPGDSGTAWSAATRGAAAPTPAGQAVAKKAATKKAVTKKAVTKKAVTKKAATRRTGSPTAASQPSSTGNTTSTSAMEHP